MPRIPTVKGKAIMTPALQSAAINRGTFRMGVQHGGEGEAVVLMHGFGLDSRSMSALGEALAGRYRVALPEWRGHGASRCPPREELYRYELFRDDLKALLDAMKIERAHLIGHSMGGQIALMLTIDQPDRVLSLTMLGAGACRAVTTDKERNMWLQAAEYYETASAPKLLRGLCAMSRISESARHKPALAQLFARARGPELAAVIRGAFLNVASNDFACTGIKPPSLVMAGVEDTDWYAHAHRLGRMIPGSRWAAIPDAGHLPHLEQPEAVTKLIGEFLDKTSRQD
jgi:pimeloyl-ACP methyl ester carboxylesterase